MTDGVLSPQPWMQLRCVSTGHTDSVARNYGATGGQDKDEVYQTLTVTWTNNTPMYQYVYGLVHQGGCAVSLQARSRGYLRMSHGMSVALEPRADPVSDLVEVSRFGGGADVGVGGTLGIGTDFCMHEVRSHSTSIPLMPHKTGWVAVSPSQTVTASVEVRFVTENWEATSITNGKENTDCTVVAGELTLDLFAVPVIESPPPRLTPTIVGKTLGIERSKDVKVAKPAGTQAGDVLLAICGNNYGDQKKMIPPPGFITLHTVNDKRFAASLDAHVKVFAKLATGSEPDSYTFENVFGSEQIVALMSLRNAIMPSTGADSNGWSVGSTRVKWKKTGDMHTAPSMATNGQLLICASFFAIADYPFDQTGPVQVQQNAPSGMSVVTGINGSSSTMLVTKLDNPPNPTQERIFTTEPRAYFYGSAAALAILVAGTQQFN